MKIKDYNDAIEFFKTNDFRAADGAWSEFYQSEVLEPRIMDLADGGRIPFEKAGSVKAYPDRIKNLAVPDGYVTAKQLAEELGISKNTLKKFRLKNLPVDKYPLKGFIDETFKPIRGAGNYTYYLKPTEKMLDNYSTFRNRTTISRDLLNDVKKLHNSKLIKDLRKSKKKVLPTLEEVVKILDKDVKSHGRAANAMATLSKMYSGEEYKLLKLPKNEETGKFIFKALRQGGKFNPYKAAFYNLAIEEIDKTLGNETGTLKNFKRYFKDNLNKYLGKGHGVSLNEVASISGMVSNDMAPYGAFVDLTNSQINKGLLANFQGTLTNALTEIDELKGNEKIEAIKKFNKEQIPNFKKQIAAKYGDEIAESIRFTEIVPGTRLTDTYKAEDLARYKDQGIDLESLAKKKDYYLDVKGAKPYTEFLENKKFKGIDNKKLLKFFKDNNIDCIKGAGGQCNSIADYQKGYNKLVQEGAEGSAKAIKKLNGFTKSMRALTGAAKWTGYGLLAEAGFMVPFAIGDYAAGESWKRILGNATDYGFGPILGQSEQEEFEAALPEGSAAPQRRKVYELGERLDRMEKRKVNPGYGRIGNRAKAEDARQKVYDSILDEYILNMQPFIRTSPHLEESRYYDQYLMNKAEQEDIATMKKLEEERQARIDERTELGIISDKNWQSQIDPRYAHAQGGIASLKRK